MLGRCQDRMSSWGFLFLDIDFSLPGFSPAAEAWGQEAMAGFEKVLMAIGVLEICTPLSTAPGGLIHSRDHSDPTTASFISQLTQNQENFSHVFISDIGHCLFQSQRCESVRNNVRGAGHWSLRSVSCIWCISFQIPNDSGFLRSISYLEP